MQPTKVGLWLAAALHAGLLLHGQTPAYDIASLQNVPVSARDGVKLGTDVYLPARNGAIAPGRFPAIVERTPYNKSSVPPALIHYYVTRGYAVVLQDVRGRFASEGQWRRSTRNERPSPTGLRSEVLRSNLWQRLLHR